MTKKIHLTLLSACHSDWVPCQDDWVFDWHNVTKEEHKVTCKKCLKWIQKIDACMDEIERYEYDKKTKEIYEVE